MLGLVQDEMDSFFPENELRHGITPKTKDRYLRTLVRNTFTFHLTEIFATIQNEYTDWTNAATILDFSDGKMGSIHSYSHFQDFNPYLMQHEASMALTDKLYTAPIQQVWTFKYILTNDKCMVNNMKKLINVQRDCEIIDTNYVCKF